MSQSLNKIVLGVLPVAAAVVLVVGAGLVHGTWTNRWNKGPHLENAIKRFQAPAPPEGKGLPPSVGNWKVSDELQMEPRVLAAAGIEAYKARRYENRSLTKPASVTLHLVCGRAGPISAHAPDICFTSSGYKMAGNQEKIVIPKKDGTPAAEFWTVRFAPPGAIGGTQVRVYWAWAGDDGVWQAPNDARWTFPPGRHPVLYKLYVQRELEKADEALKDDVSVEFLKELLPQVKEYAFPPEGK